MASSGNRQQTRQLKRWNQGLGQWLNQWLRHADGTRSLAGSITLAYVLVSIVWIFCSDRLLESMVAPDASVTELQTLKGWFFVGCTSLLLYGLIRRGVRQLQHKQHLLETIINSTPDAIFVKDNQGRYVVVNRVAAQLLGAHPAEIVGKSAAEILTPEAAQRVRSLEQALFRAGQPEEIEELLTLNGIPRWFSTAQNLCLDEQSQPMGTLGIARDITRYKQAEEELRRSEQIRTELQLLENILEVILAGYWDWDIANNRHYFSATWKQMFGYADHELPNIPETWQRLIFAEDLPKAKAGFEQHVASRGQTPFVNEVRYRHKNGSTIWVICSGCVIQWDAEGNPLRVIGCHIDITSRKRSEEALRKSERRYATLTEVAPVAICQFDAAGYCTYANERWGIMTGRPAETALGLGWLQTVPPEDRDRFSIKWFQSLQQIGSFQNESRCLRPDGSIIWFYAQVQPETDASGAIVGYVGTLTDITERKRTEAERQQAETILANYVREVEDLYNNAPCGYHSLDREGCYVSINETELQWLGYTREEVIGRPFINFISEAGRLSFQRNYPQFRERGWVKDLEFDLLCKDGTLFPVLLSATAVTDAAGNYIHSHSTLFDCRDRRQSEQQLRLSNEQMSLANAELARATRLKDEFLANMSHELRTPLTSILGMSEMLKAEIYGTLNPKQSQYIEIISESGNHLLTLINDILDLAKIESGKMELEIAATSIEPLCAASFNFVKQMAHQKNISLEMQITSNRDEIYVDERRIRQTLINLLSNAVKFTPERGRVTLEVQDHTQDKIQFSVIDTGIGIAAEDIPKLFQSFVQIDSKLSRQYSGTGLGLALVKRIAELHQGTVEVTSLPGRGSRFTITLPAQINHDFAPSLPTPSDWRSLQTLQGEHSVSTESPRTAPLILLAEDNQANIETFSSYLTGCGFRLLIAANGQEAIDLAGNHQPNLILMDVQMPGVDGLEAIRRIRADRRLAHIPIIALTALAMTGDREKCLAAGATTYLAKPVSLRQLLTTIQQFLTVF